MFNTSWQKETIQVDHALAQRAADRLRFTRELNKRVAEIQGQLKARNKRTWFKLDGVGVLSPWWISYGKRTFYVLTIEDATHVFEDDGVQWIDKFGGSKEAVLSTLALYLAVDWQPLGEDLVGGSIGYMDVQRSTMKHKLKEN